MNPIVLISPIVFLRSYLPSSAAALVSVGIGLSLIVGACSPKGPAATEKTAKEQIATDASASNAGAKSAGSQIYAADGIAIKGADPVAYFTDEAFVAGNAEYTHEWRGAIWQFSSVENRDLFAADPEQYAPQYGGYCAWAVGQNALAAIDPSAWSIVDDKLYLNANQRIQERWSKDIPGNIALAEENWPSLSQQ